MPETTPTQQAEAAANARKDGEKTEGGEKQPHEVKPPTPAPTPTPVPMAGSPQSLQK